MGRVAIMQLASVDTEVVTEMIEILSDLELNTDLNYDFLDGSGGWLFRGTWHRGRRSY